METVTLPKEVHAIEYTAKDIYDELGIEIVGEDEYTKGYEAILPEGFSLIPNGHYWTDIVDEKGQKRASFFTKMSPWDNDFFIRANIRYFIGYDPEKSDDMIHRAVIDANTNKSVFITTVIPRSDIRENRLASYDQVEKEAKDFIESNYPDYKNWKKYWD